MGVGKGNVEVVNINNLSILNFSMNTEPGEYTAANSAFLPVLHRTRECISLVLATAFLVPQELLTPDSSWCAAGEAALAFGRREGGPSERWEEGLLERWEGGSAKVAKAIPAFAFHPDSTVVACSDESLHLREGTRRPSSKCANCFVKANFMFYPNNMEGNRLNPGSGKNGTPVRVTG